MRFALLICLAACSTPAASSGDDDGPGSGLAPDGAIEEVQPEPAAGDGVADPSAKTLHDHGCAGVDWQLINGWLEIAKRAPDIAPAEELERCVTRYAGWATHAADDAGVSRAMIYAALSATGQCAAEHEYDGALMTGERCAAANAGMSAEDCAAKMASSRAFGITTLATTLKDLTQDPVIAAARLSTGSATCGGTDRWKIMAPTGFIDHFVAAYNAYTARGKAPPACKKHIVVTVALYTGMGDASEGANGCWTYERVTKQSEEWKLCQYSGDVFHPDGVKWVYDDTNTFNNLTTETNRVTACRAGVPMGGYIYMANRGSGWRKVTTTGVRSHFAEVYSSQFEIDDQFTLWKNSGEPGAPMINFGEPNFTAAQIAASTTRTCAEVPDKDWLGVYVYPQNLEDTRLDAMVTALNKCTKAN
jgi:hypothetical protein